MWWREDPEYDRVKQETIRELRHAIEQVEKDQHLNAQVAATRALLASQRCFALIRHNPDPRLSEES